MACVLKQALIYVFLFYLSILPSDFRPYYVKNHGYMTPFERQKLINIFEVVEDGGRNNELNSDLSRKALVCVY